MNRYRKAVVALVGFLAMLAADFFGASVDPELASASAGSVVDAAIAFLTALGVWAVPNRDPNRL